MTADQDRKRVIQLLERAPFSALLGLKIESAANGSATLRMPFDLRLLNEGGPTAPVHGGAIAALADVAACAALWSLAATTRTATISITVNYTGFAVSSDLIARALHRMSLASRQREGDSADWTARTLSGGSWTRPLLALSQPIEQSRSAPSARPAPRRTPPRTASRSTPVRSPARGSPAP